VSLVTTYYLEMLSPSQLNEKPLPREINIVEIESNQFQFNRFLYQLVGEAWQWTDKLALSDTEWQAYVGDPKLRTWVAYSQGAIAGYFELNAESNGDTEINYFGLAPQFIGQGIGGSLLTNAITQAWQIDTTRRVWVHTCSLDHPSALANYQARGLSLYKTEVA
jgi:GNAT superfamily N-acetyltransferase